MQNRPGRIQVAIGVLLIAGLQAHLSAQIQPAQLCWQQTGGRGAGLIPNQCPPGTEKDATGALCYSSCQAGYTGVGPLCWTQNFPWTAYGRGAGYIKDGCPDGYELDAGLCYKKCGGGFNGVGPVCWGTCGGQYPVACGAACAKTPDDCLNGIASQVLSPLEMVGNIGLTVATGGVATVGKAFIKTGLKAGVKALGKELAEAALESAATTMAEANLTGKFDPNGLDPIGIAAIVEAYNHPVCTQTFPPPAAQTPVPFRVVPAGVAGGNTSTKAGAPCEPGSYASGGKCYETCFGTQKRPGSSIPRKDTYYCDYGNEQPSFQPDNLDRSLLGKSCSAGTMAPGVYCDQGRFVEMCYGTAQAAGDYITRTNYACNYGNALPVKASQSPFSFGGKTLAYGLDANAVGSNVLAFIGSRWAFAGVNLYLNQVAAASDGSVWGVDANRQVFTWNGSSWAKMPGSLGFVAVGSARDIWGISNHDIFRWEGTGWTQVRGKLDMISVGSDGDVWGIANQSVFHYEDGLWIFRQQTPKLSWISTGGTGKVWGLTANQQVWRMNASGGWEQVGTQLLQKIQVGGSGAVWGVTPGPLKSADIVRWTGSAWQKVEAGSADVAPL